MAKWIRRGLLLMLFLVAAAVLLAWLLLRGSLPRLEGERTLEGLSSAATIHRDALGVVTVDAANETDAMRALGYAHAQERYFEMDLLRRTAAGELAELFGPVAVETDKAHRVHRFRARVDANLDAILGDRRPQLQAYVDGVNAGLADLQVRPWPYLLLRTEPEAWQLADSVLVGYAMYFDLQGGRNTNELALWKMRPHLPPALFGLLMHDGSRWDAPLAGTVRGDATLPSAADVDLRRLPAPEAGLDSAREPSSPGSNNFAVAGALTRDGRAIVADDMHLGLRAPNIWFRAQLRYADPKAPGGRTDIGGFTLPGLPFVVVGSNGHVAWAFTNSYIDAMDWAVLRPCGDAPTPGCARVVRHRERIDVADGDPVAFDVEETDWGPALERDDQGRAFALRWIAHLPGSLNVGLGDMARAASLPEAIDVSRRVAIPTQNLVIADRDGRAGWRWLGPIAMREPGCDGRLPVESTRAENDCTPWPISTSAAPMLGPTRGRLWTANSRVVDAPLSQLAGDGGSALGARARQLRDGLFAKERFDERDLLELQLDDRALFLQPWWALLQSQAGRGNTPSMRALASASSRWEGRASTRSVSYPIVRAWRRAVHARVVDGLMAPARAALGDDFVQPELQQQEGFVWPLVNQRPPHLLSRRYPSWEALFEDAAKEVRQTLEQSGRTGTRTWGEHNAARICHPMARALPFAGKALCMPADPLPGDAAMPRVQHPDFGASERMVVSPGREADGFIHMPGGQSGHPMSPFWGAGHDDWVHGRPTPFLPGEARHSLSLRPAD